MITFESMTLQLRQRKRGGNSLHKGLFPQIRFAHKVVGQAPNGPRSQAPPGNACPEALPPQPPEKPRNAKDALQVTHLGVPNMSGQSPDDMGSQAGAWESDFCGASESAELRA
jgi:hypothetical protein